MEILILTRAVISKYPHLGPPCLPVSVSSLVAFHPKGRAEYFHSPVTTLDLCVGAQTLTYISFTGKQIAAPTLQTPSCFSGLWSLCRGLSERRQDPAVEVFWVSTVLSATAASARKGCRMPEMRLLPLGNRTYFHFYLAELVYI